MDLEGLNQDFLGLFACGAIMKSEGNEENGKFKEPLCVK